MSEDKQRAPSDAGKMIAAYRQRHVLTLEQLGALLGVRWETVWRWEHGKREPPAELVRLALVGLDYERARPRRGTGTADAKHQTTLSAKDGGRATTDG